MFPVCLVACLTTRCLTRQQLDQLEAFYGQPFGAPQARLAARRTALARFLGCRH